MVPYPMRDELKCVLTEPGEQFAMVTAGTLTETTGTSMRLQLCAASWVIKNEASRWMAIYADTIIICYVIVSLVP